jgi:hypothetical protein
LAKEMAIRPFPGDRIAYPALGLGDENSVVECLSAILGFANGGLLFANHPDGCPIPNRLGKHYLSTYTGETME